MSPKERAALLALLKASVEEAKSMTPAQARQRLYKHGIYTSKGELRPEYGGPPTTEPEYGTA